MTKQNILKWTEALRSGKYKQTRNKLQDENGFCCLGVLCDLTIPKRKKIINNEGNLYGGMPIDQPKAPKWVKEIPDDFANKYGSGLSGLNDGDYYSNTPSLTFDEIADLLEAVYIHKVLD